MNATATPTTVPGRFGERLQVIDRIKDLAVTINQAGMTVLVADPDAPSPRTADVTDHNQLAFAIRDANCFASIDADQLKRTGTSAITDFDARISNPDGEVYATTYFDGRLAIGYRDGTVAVIFGCYGPRPRFVTCEPRWLETALDNAAATNPNQPYYLPEGGPR